MDLRWNCYADYEGKKIPEEYWKEAGHGQQRKNWVVEWEPEVTKDTVQPSTKNIQHPVVQTKVLIYEPVVKPTMPYPSRVNKQKLREKDDKLALKFLEIFRKLDFELSFADSLLHMPKKTRPAGIAEDVFVKVGKFYFLTDFIVVDYVVDPRVPLIIGRPFLRTEHALIDVYGEELTLRVDDEAITFKVGQTLKYSYNDADGNPASEQIIYASSPTLTPLGDSDFLLEETDAFLSIEDDSISPKIDDYYYDYEADILLVEEFLYDYPSPPLPLKELIFVEPKTEKYSIDKPPELELNDLPSHLEYAFLEGADKLPVIIAKNLNDDEKA
nr:hypothetical protein [Tanacetum cinerariifolium]